MNATTASAKVQTELTQAARGDRVRLALWLCGFCGYLARVVYAAHAVGSNDILTWERFAHQIANAGVIEQYASDRDFNHPPLMGWLSYACLTLADQLDLRFAFVFKWPAIAAELCTGWLLDRFWSRLEGPRTGALAFALYGLSPVSFLISAHHGNTDCICVLFVLASVYALQCRRAPFVAGLALAAAINVKLIPIITLPALALAGLHSKREAQRFVLGLGLGIVPFLPILWAVPPQFARNALAYSSNQENWGVRVLLGAAGAWRGAQPASLFARAYGVLGRLAILGSVAWVAWSFGPSRRLSVAALTALSVALFLVLAPGFGVQYLVYAAPLLFAVSPWRGFRYACVAGLFAAAVYLSFWDGSRPYLTWFDGRYPLQTVPFGILTWALLCGFVKDTVMSARAA